MLRIHIGTHQTADAVGPGSRAAELSAHEATLARTFAARGWRPLWKMGYMSPRCASKDARLAGRCPAWPRNHHATVPPPRDSLTLCDRRHHHLTITAGDFRYSPWGPVCMADGALSFVGVAVHHEVL